MEARRPSVISTESTNVPTVDVPSSGTHSTADTPNDVRLGRSVSIDQAAQLLRVSRRTIYYRIRDGRLQTICTIGGSQRVLVESLYASGFRSQAFSASASAVTFALRSPRA
jgi:excisionase family DNA binding protein